MFEVDDINDMLVRSELVDVKTEKTMEEIWTYHETETSQLHFVTWFYFASFCNSQTCRKSWPHALVSTQPIISLCSSITDEGLLREFA